MRLQPDGEGAIHTLIASLRDAPGLVWGYRDGPWQLWCCKQNAHYREDRPATPAFEVAADLIGWAGRHRHGLLTFHADFEREGFDHGGTARLPAPPLSSHREGAATLRTFELEEARRYRTQQQRWLQALTASIAVDLRSLGELGSDVGLRAELYLGDTPDEDDTWRLTLGPVRAVLTLEQLREVTESALRELFGERAATLACLLLDRLPEGEADMDHALRAHWLAVDSYRDLWPLRYGGYDDSAWDVDPPAGVIPQAPLDPRQAYQPPELERDWETREQHLKMRLGGKTVKGKQGRKKPPGGG